MDQYKLGVGPMSKEIIQSIDKFAVVKPMMVVASRNQVDYNSGYVCRTSELPPQFTNRSSLLLCRDHCGPYFKDTDKGLSVEDAIIECKKTIDADISAGFDLIHVDVSKIPEDQLYYAKILIEYILDKSPDMLLEFGSEDNTGEDLASSESRIDEQLAFIQQYKHNIVYFVSQTGSLTKHTQVGIFDVEANKKLADKIHSAGFKFKEHNADYLTDEEIDLRKSVGVDALNIAPQLGAVQTKITEWASKRYHADLAYTAQWNAFSDMVYSKDIWKRWVTEGLEDKEIAVHVSGHYFFNTPEYKSVLSCNNDFAFNEYLGVSIEKVLKAYTRD